MRAEGFVITISVIQLRHMNEENFDPSQRINPSFHSCLEQK